MAIGTPFLGEKPLFHREEGVLIQFLKIKDSGLRMTPGVLTVVYVLEGEIYVKVSCEEFRAKAGEYLVLNQGDPYFLTDTESHPGSSIVALLQFDLASFNNISPYLLDILFACESFDLPRYKNEELLLRNMLNRIIKYYETKDPHLEASCRDFLAILVKGYTLYNYYNRAENLTQEKVETYFRITQYMASNLCAKNLLNMVAEKEHYTKTYISHLFREVAFGSFSDTLSFLRIFEAEKMLLLTDKKIAEISFECGFSDVKYFNRNFKKWFHQSPTEFRKRMKPRVYKDPQVEYVPFEIIKTCLDAIEENKQDATTPRLSITPTVLKTIGTNADLLKRLENYQNENEFCFASAASAVNLSKNETQSIHIMPLLITDETVFTDDISLMIDSLLQVNVTPCLVFSFTSKKQTLNRFDSALTAVGKDRLENIQLSLKYSCLGSKTQVDQLITKISEKWGSKITPLFIP